MARSSLGAEEIEPGGSDTWGHYLHRMKADSANGH
jgi:hypothetical protein